jgi:RNA-binding protein
MSEEHTPEIATPHLVESLSPNLNGAQRRHLRSLAHDLNPVVLVGHRGITDSLIDNVEAALLAHELIRIKIHDADEIDSCAQLIHDKTQAQLAQKLGKTLLFFRAHPSNPTITLPGQEPPKRAAAKPAADKPKTSKHKTRPSSNKTSARKTAPKRPPQKNSAPRSPKKNP